MSSLSIVSTFLPVAPNSLNFLIKRFSSKISSFSKFKRAWASLAKVLSIFSKALLVSTIRANLLSFIRSSSLLAISSIALDNLSSLSPLSNILLIKLNI